MADGPTKPRDEETRPQDVQAALESFTQHGRAAAAEALLAARALVDAISLGLIGTPATHATDDDIDSDLRHAFAGVADAIDAVTARVSGGGASAAAPLVGAVLSALDQEIRRWEARSRSDTEARAVLRAFLGLRELLWELGLRDSGPDAREASDEDGSRTSESARPHPARRNPRPAARTAPTREEAARSRPARVRRIVIDGN